jgi:hypothetical protein
METQVVPHELSGGTATDLLTHPDDVIADSGMSQSEKRAILANWASDARVIENAPELRQLDNGTIVRVDDVLNALRLLDNATGQVFSARRPPFARRRKVPLGRWTFANEPDDDAPPPCAAGASIPDRPIYTIATAVSRAEAA